MKTFGENLRALRIERKYWFQRDLAERIKVSENTVQAWEAGRTWPGYWNLLELSRALDVPLDALMLPR